MRDLYVIALIIALIVPAWPAISATPSDATYHVRYHVSITGEARLGSTKESMTYDYYLDLNITFSGDTVSYCTKATGQNLPNWVPKVQSCKTMDLETFMNEMLSSLPTIPVMSSKIGSASYELLYLGRGNYNGLPVYKYRLTAQTTLFDIQMEFYLYAGMPIPLYASVNMNTTATLNIKITTESTNLPSSVPAAEATTSKYYIIIGGLPGAQISVTGQKGENMLKVENNGDNPGYILVISRTGEKGVIKPVLPGQTINVNLPENLDQNINLKTQQFSGSQLNMSYVYAGIGLAVIGAIIATIYKITRKTPKTTATPTQETPVNQGQP